MCMCVCVCVCDKLRLFLSFVSQLFLPDMSYKAVEISNVYTSPLQVGSCFHIKAKNSFKQEDLSIEFMQCLVEPRTCKISTLHTAHKSIWIQHTQFCPVVFSFKCFTIITCTKITYLHKWTHRDTQMYVCVCEFIFACLYVGLLVSTQTCELISVNAYINKSRLPSSPPKKSRPASDVNPENMARFRVTKGQQTNISRVYTSRGVRAV